MKEDETSLFWMKCVQLPDKTVLLLGVLCTKIMKTVKNHKRRNVTDHIVRGSSL